MGQDTFGNGGIDWGGVASNIFKGTQQAPATGAPSTSTGGSALDQILAGLANHKSTTGERVADVGSILGAFSSGEKANRTSYGDMRQGYDRMMLGDQIARNNFGLENEQQRNANESDALKKLQQGTYLAGGGAHYQAPSFSLGGQTRTAPSFSFAPQDATDAEKDAGGALASQMSNRLAHPSFTPDWSFKPKDVESYANPGTMEKIGSYGALGGGVLGNMMDIFSKGQQQPQGGGNGAVINNLVSNYGGTASKLLGGSGNLGGDVVGGLSKLFHIGGSGSAPTASAGSSLTGAMGGAGNVLGKAIPIAGAVTGGIGLLHNQGTKRNVINGMQTGSSIGTMITPGIGTAIGAGVGALAGWARGIGAPSQQELAGRESAGQIRQMLASSATPAQTQEAQKSGWDKPQDALSFIVMRDKLNAMGAAPDEANHYMDSLFKAEKQGPQAVQQVVSSIEQRLNGSHV